jgi:hypothetical protein
LQINAKIKDQEDTIKKLENLESNKMIKEQEINSKIKYEFEIFYILNIMEIIFNEI